MKLLIGSSNIKPVNPYPVVAIGNFDGLHLGHQAILSQAMKRAKENDGTSIVLTFEPHPRKVFYPEKTFKLLNTFQIKTRLIEATGIDLCYVTEFNQGFLGLSPEAFSKKFLHEKIGCKEVVIGKNFRFGKDRSGDLEDLIHFGELYGFKVLAQEPVWINETAVSSSQIRKLLREGNVALAGKMMGRFYILEGKVIHGDGMGASLGYPTANLRLPNELIPSVGIYAARVDFMKTEGHKTQDAIVYIGSKPTFSQKAISIEIHLLDLNKDLYGKRIRVTLLDWIRGDEQFENKDALVRQIALDIQQARLILKKTGLSPA